MTAYLVQQALRQREHRADVVVEDVQLVVHACRRRLAQMSQHGFGKEGR